MSFNEYSSYDMSKYEIVVFKQKGDTYNGISLNFGASIIDYPVIFGRYRFKSPRSILMYFHFGNSGQLKKQNQLLSNQDNFHLNKLCDDVIDERYAINFYLYTTWLRLQQNPEFKESLLALPENCIIVKDDKTRWGCTNVSLQNALLQEARTIEELVSTERERKQRITQFRLSYNKGTWVGYNHWGKILMECRDCLIKGTTPKIDLDYLNKFDNLLFGEKYQFKVQSSKN